MLLSACALMLAPAVRPPACGIRPPPMMSMDEGTAEPPPERLLQLLLQCGIQAQLSYYNEFKNEVRARWLEAFLGHNHLAVQRVSDRGGGMLLYKGMSDGIKCSHDDYLRTMVSPLKPCPLSRVVSPLSLSRGSLTLLRSAARA